MDIAVEGMTCQHCVHAVTEALTAVPGVVGVAVDLAAGQVTIKGQPDPVAIRNAITAEGYTVLP